MFAYEVSKILIKMTRISAGDNAYWHNLSEFVKYCMQEDAAQVTLRNKWVTLNIFIIIKKGRKNKRRILFMNLGEKGTNVRKLRGRI